MPTVLVAAPAPLAGKTTVAVACARALAKSGTKVSLERAGDDANADEDRRVFGSLGTAPGDARMIEIPAGDPSAALGEHDGARVLIVATPETVAETMAIVKAVGLALAGVVLNRARPPGGQAGADFGGVALLAVIPEDERLAAPGLDAVAAALNAEALNINGSGPRSLGRLVIASIAADPGQAYFDRTRAESVIVRSDKPDLQLAAINAGAQCLIVTGDSPVLSYVRDRVAEDETPFLRTALDTKGAVEAIEALYGATAFTAGAEGLSRLDELFASADLSSLFATAG
ncbi:MAG TPA: DRTGG domain-containing protein [Dehalococcoidia bacterium]